MKHEFIGVVYRDENGQLMILNPAKRMAVAISDIVSDMGNYYDKLTEEKIDVVHAIKDGEILNLKSIRALTLAKPPKEVTSEAQLDEWPTPAYEVLYAMMEDPESREKLIVMLNACREEGDLTW